jgi:hypothetical protein
MRDIGLEDAAYKLGTHGERIQNMRWSYSLLGQEYARAHSWGSAPKTTVVREDKDVVRSDSESLIFRRGTC